MNKPTRLLLDICLSVLLFGFLVTGHESAHESVFRWFGCEDIRSEINPLMTSKVFCAEAGFINGLTSEQKIAFNKVQVEIELSGQFIFPLWFLGTIVIFRRK